MTRRLQLRLRQKPKRPLRETPRPAQLRKEPTTNPGATSATQIANRDSADGQSSTKSGLLPHRAVGSPSVVRLPHFAGLAFSTSGEGSTAFAFPPLLYPAIELPRGLAEVRKAAFHRDTLGRPVWVGCVTYLCLGPSTDQSEILTGTSLRGGPRLVRWPAGCRLALCTAKNAYRKNANPATKPASPAPMARKCRARRLSWREAPPA